MAPSIVSAILTRIGMGKLGRVGLEPAQRYERERPGELVHIDIKSSGGSNAAPEPGSSAWPTGEAARSAETSRGSTARPPAGSTSTSRSTTAHASRTPRCCATTGAHRRRVPQASGPVLRPARSHRRTRTDRQRVLLLRNGSRDRLPGARDPPPAHPPLPAADQWQGRAVHPHAARRLGVRRRLPQLGRAHRRPRRLAVVLQPPTKTLSPRPQAPDRPPQRANQPSWDLHLGSAANLDTVVSALLSARSRFLARCGERASQRARCGTLKPRLTFPPQRLCGPVGTHSVLPSRFQGYRVRVGHPWMIVLDGEYSLPQTAAI